LRVIETEDQRLLRMACIAGSVSGVGDLAGRDFFAGPGASVDFRFGGILEDGRWKMEDGR